MKNIVKHQVLSVQWLALLGIIVVFFFISRTIQLEKGKIENKTNPEMLRSVDMIDLRFSTFLNN